MMNPDIRAVFIMARCRVVDWSLVAKTGFWYMNITSLIGREPNRYRLASRLGFRNSLEWKGGGGRACITRFGARELGFSYRLYWRSRVSHIIVHMKISSEYLTCLELLVDAWRWCSWRVYFLLLHVGTGSESWVFYCWANRSFSIKNAVFEHKAVDTVSHGWWSEFVIRTVSSY